MEVLGRNIRIATRRPVIIDGVPLRCPRLDHGPHNAARLTLATMFFSVTV